MMSGSTSQQSKSPMNSLTKRDIDKSPKQGSSQQTPVGDNSSQQRTSSSSMADFGSQLRLPGSLEPDDLDDQRSRNHSLKYSKGALTGNSVQVHFDETVLIPKTTHEQILSQRPIQQQQPPQQQYCQQQVPQQPQYSQQQVLQHQLSLLQTKQPLQSQQPYQNHQQHFPQQQQSFQQQQQPQIPNQQLINNQIHDTITVTDNKRLSGLFQPVQQQQQQQEPLRASKSPQPILKQITQPQIAQQRPIPPYQQQQQQQQQHQQQQGRKQEYIQKSASPVLDRKAGLTRKVLLNNCAKHASVDFPEPKCHNLPRRAQSMRVTPLLRVMGRDTGSGTPSPMSSPSPSSDEEDGSGSSPARTPRRYKSRENFGSLERSASSSFKAPAHLTPASTSSVVRSASYSKIIQISRQKRDFDHTKMSNSFGVDAGSDDGEEHRRRRLQMSSSMKIRGPMAKNNSLEVPGSPEGSTLRLACTPPGVPVAMHSIRRDSFDIHQVKSRSLMCLAAATAAEIAGHPLLADHARSGSYLSGSSGSMLGSDELDRYFPDRKLRLFVGSWNMNGQTPPAYLADFLLPQHIEYVPDILVVGTQECLNETKEWESRLQGTLGPSHVMFHSHSLGTLHLAIFIRRDLIWFCSMPEVDSFSTRPTATFKTKGAVAIAFLLFGTSFLFVNSHLTAHQENVRDRVKDLKKINAMLSLPRTLPIKKKYQDLADNFDCAFWCGDLNFRLEQTREVVIREVKDGTSILDFDQLNYLKNEGLIFNGYIEDPIKFPPTYKYDPGTNNFDTSSKQRVPSYTDRILYKCHKSSPVTPLHYDSVRDVVTSDHRPVWGMWETLIRPGKEIIPLSGGLFNREIYLDGLKRRSEALKPTSGGRLSVNSMCSLQ